MSARTTPCVGRCSHCVGDYICRGCGRTVEQVRDWNTYSADKKARIMAGGAKSLLVNPCSTCPGTCTEICKDARP